MLKRYQNSKLKKIVDYPFNTLEKGINKAGRKIGTVIAPFTKEARDAEDSFNKLVKLRFRQRYGRKPMKEIPETTTPDTKKLEQVKRDVKEELKKNTSVNPRGAITIEPKPIIRNSQPVRPLLRRRNMSIPKYS